MVPAVIETERFLLLLGLDGSLDAAAACGATLGEAAGALRHVP